jgi:hypothetical protein
MVPYADNLLLMLALLSALAENCLSFNAGMTFGKNQWGYGGALISISPRFWAGLLAGIKPQYSLSKL